MGAFKQIILYGSIQYKHGEWSMCNEQEIKEQCDIMMVSGWSHWVLKEFFLALVYLADHYLQAGQVEKVRSFFKVTLLWYNWNCLHNWWLKAQKMQEKFNIKTQKYKGMDVKYEHPVWI
jgi:hypothetical protein